MKLGLTELQSAFVPHQAAAVGRPFQNIKSVGRQNSFSKLCSVAGRTFFKCPTSINTPTLGTMPSNCSPISNGRQLLRGLSDTFFKTVLVFESGRFSIRRSFASAGQLPKLTGDTLADNFDVTFAAQLGATSDKSLFKRYTAQLTSQDDTQTSFCAIGHSA